MHLYIPAVLNLLKLLLTFHFTVVWQWQRPKWLLSVPSNTELKPKCDCRDSTAAMKKNYIFLKQNPRKLLTHVHVCTIQRETLRYWTVNSQLLSNCQVHCLDPIFSSRCSGLKTSTHSVFPDLAGSTTKLNIGLWSHYLLRGRERQKDDFSKIISVPH